MRFVKAFVPPEVLAWRKRIGADRRDEMWDGVLHMAPAPQAEARKRFIGNDLRRG
ncbi:MAG: hypothetical protein IPN34_10795 [Planctomycetes bacterium]|nr:hypothetical protein [Planctomycetota bacterium]